MAVWLGKKLGRIDSSVTNYQNLFGTWGLYKTSIKKVKLLLEYNGFRIIRCKPRYFHLLDSTKIPILKEILTWHAEFYCKKDGIYKNE